MTCPNCTKPLERHSPRQRDVCTEQLRNPPAPGSFRSIARTISINVPGATLCHATLGGPGSHEDGLVTIGVRLPWWSWLMLGLYHLVVLRRLKRVLAEERPVGARYDVRIR